MKTKHIGIKELRQNLFKVAKKLEKPGEEIVVFRNNKPVFTLNSVVHDGDDYFTAEDIASIKRGEEDVRMGRVYTLGQVDQRLKAREAKKSTSRRKRKKT